MLYLSQVIGRPVRDRQDEPMGKVADLIVAVGDRYPPVTGLVVRTDQRRIFVPWSDVAHLDGSGAQLGARTIDIDKFHQRPNEILLRADLMDMMRHDTQSWQELRELRLNFRFLA